MSMKILMDYVELLLQAFEDYYEMIGRNGDFRQGHVNSCRLIELRSRVSDIIASLYAIRDELEELSDKERGIIWKAGKK